MIIGQVGCLIIHGFTGGAYEVNPLARYLQSNTDWIVSVPVLPGHGRNLHLKDINANEWIAYAEEELERLRLYCDVLYVIGFSMGGLIAAHLANKYPVSKLVLLSTAALYINTGQILRDIQLMVKDGLQGKLHENEWFGHYKYKLVNTPISATWEFKKIAQSTVPLLSKVDVPTFVAQGQKDGIVPPKAARYVYDQLDTYQKKLYFSKNAKHLICYAPDSEKLFNEVAFFLKCTYHPDDG